MAKTLSNCVTDRLTSLPDTLLVEILSLLPFKSAAATSVLSRRWCHLWTQLPHLFLDGPWPRSTNSDYFLEFHQFITTVDHILHQITSHHIQTFHLHIPFPPTLEKDEFDVFSAYFESWIRLICVRNVVKIKVSCDFPVFISPHVPLPSFIFETESLVELELGGNLRCKLPETGIVNLPNLKKVVLIDLPINRSVFKTLFTSSPLLETLSLELDSDSANFELLNISSQNLKSLIIRGKSRHFMFMIDAPTLEHIEIRGFLGIYKFVKLPARLLSADLDISNFSYSRTDYLTHIPELVQGISSVESLNLLNGLAVFNALNTSDLIDLGSVFRNLVHLRLDMTTNEADLGDRNPIPVCLLSKLKKIMLLNIKGNTNDVKLLVYILSKAINLDRLYVSSVYDGNGGDGSEGFQLWREYELPMTMLMVPWSSKIEFDGDCIRLLSNDMSQNGFIVKVN
ncbi:F-box/LRR-repeat protein 13-like [Spinacia oleracea]|uniref:F-box/LRR-repeat protein 13-like n=1 Tax=Spinacia oleracea TaxID=3562 RepID=A0A9R0I1Z0_SPIOL|nr:F-box/LRR-repeat protein 13-like [Spinacia oleracea]